MAELVVHLHIGCSLGSFSSFRVKRSLWSITRSGSISMTTCGQAVFCTQDVPSGHTDYSVNIVRPLDHVLLLPRVILCFLCFLNVLRQKVLIDTFISLFLYEKYQRYRVFFTVLPQFQHQNEAEKHAQLSRSFLKSKITFSVALVGSNSLTL